MLNRYALLRWLWVAGLGAAGACAFYASWVWLGPDGLPLRVPTSLRPWAVWTLTALFLGLVGRTGGWYVRMRVPADFRNGLRFPPLWFAVVLAVGLVWVTNSLAELSPLRAPIDIRWDSFTGSLAAVFISALLWPKRWPWQERKQGAVTTASATITNWPTLAAWAEREMPAGPDQPDLFDGARIARRLAKRLCRPWGSDETIALLGPYGSGKTTLLNWLRAELQTAANPAVWICQVNAWGLEKSATAPSYVLSRILDTIDQAVDCQPLRGLPSAYQQILSADPTGVAQRLAALVSPPDDAILALQELTPLLNACDARLVLLVEDIDRAGPDFHPEHVLRLLWSLRQVQGVSFVLAFDPRRADLQYSKLCDHVEVLPQLDADAVRRPLRALVDYCHSAPQTSPPLIDPAHDDDRGDPLDLHDSQSPLEAYAWLEYRNSPADALTALLTTPRMLKHVVRWSRRVWDALRGEIDIYDVILITALREGAPEAYEFLVAHMDAVRQGKRSDSPGRADTEKVLLERWKSLCGDGPRAQAIQTIVDALRFPRLATAARSPRAQGLAARGATDYFRRLLAEEVSEGELRDQTVLSDTAAYLRGDGSRLLTELLAATEADRRYVDIWEHFAHLVPVERLQPLADEIVAALIARDGRAATGSHPAVLAAWRRCNLRLSRGPEHADWLARLIRSALPISLHLADDLYYFWASVRYGIVDQDCRKRVRVLWVTEARSRYSSSTALSSALDPAWPACIRHLVRPDDSEEPVSDLIEPSQWAWLAKPLLDGLAADSSLFLPEVLNVVGDSRTERRAMQVPELAREDTYALDRDRITGMFGQRTRDLLRVLAESSADYGAAAEARGQARTWLSEPERAF